MGVCDVLLSLHSIYGCKHTAEYNRAEAYFGYP